MNTYYYDYSDTESINLNITIHTQDKSCRHDKNSCKHLLMILLYIFVFFVLLCLTYSKNNKVKDITTSFDDFFKEKVENDNISRTCIICYDNISYDDLIFTKCNHYFHEFCIRKWLSINQVCPICKRQYDVNV